MKKRNKISNNLALINLIIFTVVVAVVVIGGAYLIANSNLPDWFKFWLLK